MLKRIFYILAILIMSVFILIKLQAILAPMVFAIILFVVLRPVHKGWLGLVRMRIVAVLLTLITGLIPVCLFIVFFSFQILDVIQNLPSISDRLQAGLDQAFAWLSNLRILQGFDFSQYVEEAFGNTVTQPFDLLAVGISESTQTFANLFLTFLYLLFLLLYHDGIREWVRRVGGENNSKWLEIVEEVKEMIEHYLIGVITVVGILSVLNSLGLMAIGLQYAVFWGILAGFLALIPYIGTTLGGLFPLLYALASSDGWFQPVMVVVLFGTIQFVEGNFITPKIVGNQVSLNPLTAVVALVVGAYTWGLAGVVLAIPMAGVLRIVFSHFSRLQHLAFVMGTEVSHFKRQ